MIFWGRGQCKKKRCIMVQIVVTDHESDHHTKDNHWKSLEMFSFKSWKYCLQDKFVISFPTLTFPYILFTANLRLFCSNKRILSLLIRGFCADLKTSVDSLASKMNEIKIVQTSASEATASNNYSNNNHASLPHKIVPINEDTDFEISLTGLESDVEQQIVKLFRRLSLPFKKANRRLRDMEDIGNNS